MSTELSYHGEGTYTFHDAAAGRSWDVERGDTFTTSDEHAAELLAVRPSLFATPGGEPKAKQSKKAKPGED